MCVRLGSHILKLVPMPLLIEQSITTTLIKQFFKTCLSQCTMIIIQWHSQNLYLLATKVSYEYGLMSINYAAHLRSSNAWLSL